MSSPVKLLLLTTAVLVSSLAQALTLGNLTGSVLVGRTLNLTVPIQVEQGAASGTQCTQVDIFHAETRLDRSVVQTSWQALDTKSSSGVLKIVTTVPVDEPMVSVHIRAGCSDKTERRYVLLADMPTELPSATTALPIVGRSDRDAIAVPDAPTVTPASSQPPTPRSSTVVTPFVGPAASNADAVAAVPVPKARLESGAAVATVPAKRASASVPPVQRPLKPPVAIATANREAMDVKPRLRLDVPPDSLELNLKASRNLVSPSEDGGPARAEAKALWLILNTPPEQLSAESSRLQALEAQIKTLQSNASRSQAEQARLQNELAKVEDDLVTNGIIGLVAVLLMGGLSAATYLWLKTRRSTQGFRVDWFRKRDDEPSLLGGLADNSLSQQRHAGSSGRVSLAPDVDLSVFDSILDDGAANRHPVAGDSLPSLERYDSVMTPSGFFNSAMGSRALNVEELFDVQQQAEFFVSLGQHEQAIDLLRNHIASTPGTSGVAYLDLLHLLYKFDRRPEFDRLRDEFNFSFNSQVPPFDNFAQFEQNRRGIERYPSAMSRIESLWKTPQILGQLEQFIFRKPEAGDAEVFDLEAYRELLLLFAIANEIQDAQPGGTDAAQVASSSGIGMADSIMPSPGFFDGKSARQDLPSAVMGKDDVVDLDLDVDLFALEVRDTITTEEVPPAAEGRVLEALDFSLSFPISLEQPEPEPEPEPENAPSSIELEISRFLEDRNSSLNFTDSELAPPVQKKDAK